MGAWNYPLQSCTWKVGPALACGNTFVYKPSPLTPLSAVVLGEVLQVLNAFTIYYWGVTIRPSPLTPLSAVVLGEVLQVPNALTLVSYFIAKYWGGGGG